MTPEEFTKRIERAALEMKPALELDALKIGELVKEIAQKHILGHEHSEWPPLLPQTIDRKERGGFKSEGPLVRTGALKHSIKVVVGPMEVTISSDDPAAAAMEFGTSRDPPRPWLRLAAERALPEVIKILGHSMLKPFLGYGYRENPEFGEFNRTE